MKKKADYQKMLLKMIRPLTRHYTDDGSGLYLGAFSAGYGNRIDWRQERILRLLLLGRSSQ